MNNAKRKTLKGLTLIELILVMAIFSLLLVGVLAFFTPVEKIFMKCFGRGSRVASGEKVGDLITEARFKLNGLTERYIRVVLNDGKGKFAWSQPCWDPLGMENGKYGPETYRRIYNVDEIR